MSKAINSFVKGMGQALDMGGTMTPARNLRVARVSDAQALRGDWKRVGDDVRRAMKQSSKNTATSRKTHGK